MALTKHKLNFDPASASVHDRVGSFLIGEGGNVVDSQTINSQEWLNAAAALFDGSGNALSSTGGALHISDGGGSITIDGTVSVSDFTFDYAEDSAHGSGDVGAFVLAVRADTKASTADTDGDYAALIQDADGDLYVSDTVAQGSLSTIAGAVSGTEMQVDIVGPLPAGTNNIGDVDILTMPGTYVEDAVAAGGETGFLMLGIRQDAAGSPVSADNDYHPFVFNNDGELKVASDLTSDIADDAADSGNPIKVGGKAYTQASALSALSADGDRFNLAGDLYRRLWINESCNVGWSIAAVAVGTTAVQLDSSKQAGRKKVVVQNLSDKDMFLGNSSGVLTTTGIILPKDTSLELPWGEALDIYAIGDTGASAEDIRIAQLA